MPDTTYGGGTASSSCRRRGKALKKASITTRAPYSSLHTPHGLFKSVCARLGYGVPELWGAEVDIVDAEQVHILDVPCERGPPHAEVEIGGVDTGNTLG